MDGALRRRHADLSLMNSTKAPRYFVLGESGEEGPYTLDVIRESIRAGRFSRDVVVRPEDGGEPQRVGDAPDAPRYEAAPTPSRRRRKPRLASNVDSTAPEEPEEQRYRNPSQEPGGSFWLGFLAGALGGLIVVVLFLRRARVDTRRGVVWGFVLQLVVFLLVRVAAG